MVDITDGHYNTKTSIKTCPTKNQCYCGQEFASSEEFKTHEKQHAGQAWACFECDKKSKGNDKHVVYKHYRTKHERRHLHQCTFDICSVDGHPFGNDEQYMVWWHMQEDHGLCSPLGCPKCEGTFHSKVNRNIFPLAQAKRMNLALNRHHMQRKSLDVMSVQRNIPWRLHSCSTRKCTKALQRSMCAASVVRL